MVIDIYKFIGKKDKTYEIEQSLNANCKQEEKSGSGPGSCGGSKSANAKDIEEQHFKESKDLVAKIESARGAKKRESENRSAEPSNKLKFPKRALRGAKEAAMYTDISPKDWKKMKPENKQSWAKSEAKSQIEEWALDAGWPYSSDEEDVMAKEIASEFIKIMDTGRRPSIPRRKKTAGDYAQYD